LIKELSFLSLAPKENETFAVIGMTNKHKFIGITEFYKGTVDKCTVHSRPIVSWALQHNVAAVIFVHNHPSGNTYPSKADINMTETLKKSLALIDVRVLDHFIVGSNMSSMFSFRENGLLT
jgi:DNA repair protein RadC